ncbi:hypothetical protein EON83_01520 [bacterium]|nr:MAG: hypothetical protein EON83_01520 [bacterium]
MIKPNVWGAAALLSLALLPSCGDAQEKLSPFATLLVSAQKKNANDFTLATTKGAAPIYLDGADFPVVRIAAEALAGDIEKVTTAKPNVLSTPPAAGETAVFIGTVGKSQLIDRLVAQKKLDVSAIRGQWERYVITTVENPLPGVRQALVIAGSDRRGTAYGAFSVSESIGVSPWVWWADVTPQHRDSLVFPRARFASKAPSVKYRGIFINDEDWGLLPWSKKNEPEVNTIGPKTYEKVGELLLRLKANYLWPAMHEATVAFNQIPENKLVMDRYAIVMGSSHPEPLLFNNASEWKYPKNQWNYDTHSDLIKGVWEKRLQENHQFENSYTVGLRGIHDTGMQGSGTVEDGVRRLERVVKDQRELLAKYVNPKVDEVPQVFVPYKEVLPIYQAGMKVPDDVTLVWVDDNHGYIRQLSTPAEQKRTGSAGVYYHFSYLGAPESFLWLGSTSPALAAYEMQKAYAYGADRLWVFNVGDIKPIEKEMEFGMRLAYDINSYPVDKAMNYLADFATENFGAPYAQQTASILEQYYHLVAQIKPEHNDRMTMSPAEQDARLAAYSSLVQQAEKLSDQIPADKKDSFFELVLYPVKGAALMNIKQTALIRGDVDTATKAFEEIQQISVKYNKEIVGGKWDRMMNYAPNNARVFRRPGDSGIRGQVGTPVLQVDAKSATLSGSMKLVDDAIVATSPEVQTESSGNVARFTLNSPEARKGTIYFLTQTPDDKHDSWFVTLNGKKVTVNDNVTGNFVNWIKVMDADLVAGENTFTVEQREGGTALYRIAVMEGDKVPAPVVIKRAAVAAPTPRVIEADAYSQIKNSGPSQWKKINGLGWGKSAMTLLPFQTKSITDANQSKAPAITYSFPSTAPQATIETRFLPTHRVNQNLGLRYSISVDGGPTQIQDYDTLEYSGDWGRNVLAGYAPSQTTHKLKDGANHTVTIRFLDPGMVLSQVRVFDK